MATTGYGARTDALLDRLGGDLTEQDFLDLAVACLDQCGLPVRDQLDVTRVVERALEHRILSTVRTPDVVDARLAVDVNVDGYGRRTARS